MRFATLSGRLGERQAVNGIVVDWNVDGRRTRGLLKRAHEVADVIDISVSGAQLLAQRSRKLGVGTKVMISAGGSFGTVRIRRISDLANGDLCSYGVEFISIDRPLEALLGGYAIDHIPESVQLLWRSKDSSDF